MGRVSNFKKQISNLNFAKPHGVSLNFPKKQKEKERKKERKKNKLQSLRSVCSKYK